MQGKMADQLSLEMEHGHVGICVDTDSLSHRPGDDHVSVTAPEGGEGMDKTLETQVALGLPLRLDPDTGRLYWTLPTKCFLLSPFNPDTSSVKMPSPRGVAQRLP